VPVPRPPVQEHDHATVAGVIVVGQPEVVHDGTVAPGYDTIPTPNP
jgi:hypothetical protein